jgi:hypothetical protein
VVAGCKAFDGGWVGSATKAQIPKVAARAWAGAVAAMAPNRAGRKTRSSQTRFNSLVSSSARLDSLEFLNELSLGFSSVI